MLFNRNFQTITSQVGKTLVNGMDFQHGHFLVILTPPVFRHLLLIIGIFPTDRVAVVYKLSRMKHNRQKVVTTERKPSRVFYINYTSKFAFKYQLNTKQILWELKLIHITSKFTWLALMIYNVVHPSKIQGWFCEFKIWSMCFYCYCLAIWNNVLQWTQLW